MILKHSMMTSDFHWVKPGQVRISVMVDSAIDLVTHPPRPVDNMPLDGWSLVQNGPQYGVRHITGITSKYHPHKLPATLQGMFPVLVGAGNGKLFLIDGAHRMAKALIDGHRHILAVSLTEAETRSCIRPMMADRFNKAVGLLANSRRES